MPSADEPADKRGPLHIEPALSAMHALPRSDGSVKFSIANEQGKIGFFVECPSTSASLIESQLYAQYPDIDIENIPSSFLAPTGDEVALTLDLGLLRHEMFPIKRHPEFDDLLARQTIDTLAGITSSLVRFPHPGMRASIDLEITPLSSRYRKRVLKFLPLMEKGLSKRFSWYAKLFASVHLARGWRWWLLLPPNLLMGGFRAWFSFLPKAPSLSGESERELSTHEETLRTGRRSHESEDPISAAIDKVNRLLFESSLVIRIYTPVSEMSGARKKLQEIASSYKQFSLPGCNGFTLRSIREGMEKPSGSFVLSVEEVATLWHLPTLLVKTPGIDWVQSRKLEPPVNVPLDGAQQDLTILGEAVFRGRRHRFGIKPDDRRRHMYVIGKTGMGKSTLLENMIFSDVQSGRGVGVIDPHGDLIEAVLRFIPSSRTNDVILFDPQDTEYPVSFNMLSCPEPKQYPLVVSGLMSVFTKLWPDVWSGRMEHILRNTLLALIEGEGNSMLGILRMFSDDAFRRKVVEHTKDHFVRSFWEDEYAGWSEKYRTEAIAAIQNKIGQLLSVPMIRNIVGQSTSKLSLREAMDTGKIVLVNLSKGNLGEDNSAFLGSMLVTKFQLDAMSRADVPEKERRDFYLYVDEFQNFATESFASILSEARKYRLSLTLANQYIGQLLIGDKNTALKDAVFGNVGSLATFQVGSDDAEVLSLQLEELASPNDILSLPKYHAYMRLMIDGLSSKPFSVSTLPPPAMTGDDERMKLIRRASRERYTEKRALVEEKIGRWLESARAGKTEAKNAEKAKEKDAEERERARKKGMKLDEYRAWRDREMWTNDFNALRKKSLSTTLSSVESALMQELQAKLEKSGGIPPPSKAMQEAMQKHSQRAG